MGVARTRWFVVTAACALLGAARAPAATEEAKRPTVVSYLVAVDSSATVPDESDTSEERLAGSRWQWRIFDPASGRDTLVFDLPAFPTRIRWNFTFDSVEFLLSNRILFAPWRIGDRPRVMARLPGKDPVCDFWQGRSIRWHILTEREVNQSIGPDMVRILRIVTQWDQSTSGRWRIASVDTLEGEGGCFAEGLVSGSAEGHVRVAALLDSMRIGYKRASVMAGSDGSADSDPLVRVSSEIDSLLGVEVRLGFGDSGHAMAPVTWVDRGRNTRHLVFADSLRAPQVGLAERGGFMLIASEYSGSFPAVVDLRSGRVLLSVTRPSARAVWVAAPW